MAFLRKAGSILGRTVNQGTSMSNSPSILQAVRWMSSSKVFVGGLSYNTDETGLREAFDKYGQVVDVRLIVDRETNRSRGFGFITYTSPEEASSAIQALDQQDLHGRTIKVNYATDKPRGAFGGGGFGGGGYGGGGYGGGGGGYGGGYGGSGGGYGGGSYGGGESQTGGSVGYGVGSGGYGGGSYGGGAPAGGESQTGGGSYGNYASNNSYGGGNSSYGGDGQNYGVAGAVGGSYDSGTGNGGFDNNFDGGAGKGSFRDDAFPDTFADKRG